MYFKKPKKCEIIFSKELVPYMESYNFMEQCAEEIGLDKHLETIWFLEHPPVYTAGSSSNEKDFSGFENIPLFKTNRGGKHTHHAPGQCICYLMLNLKKRSQNGVPDPRAYVKLLEKIVINALAKFGVKGEIRPDRIGVWVLNGDTEEKIAAIGVKFKRGVTMHGFALNISNDLNLFKGIVPCGISNYGVCSLESLGIKASMDDVKQTLLKEIKREFFSTFSSPFAFHKKNDKNSIKNKRSEIIKTRKIKKQC